MRSLTGAPLITAVRTDTHVPTMTPTPMPMSCSPPMAPMNPGLVCDGLCRDIINDPQNCGGCNIVCNSYCVGGMCGP
jgi:hypothetical protein